MHHGLLGDKVGNTDPRDTGSGSSPEPSFSDRLVSALNDKEQPKATPKKPPRRLARGWQLKVALALILVGVGLTLTPGVALGFFLTWIGFVFLFVTGMASRVLLSIFFALTVSCPGMVRESTKSREAEELLVQQREQAEADRQASLIARAPSEFEARKSEFNESLDVLETLIQDEGWAEALEYGKTLREILDPLFHSSIAGTPDVVEIRQRLEEAERLGRQEEARLKNLANRAASRVSNEAFRKALESGASCEELFDIRNQQNPNSRDTELMNDALGSVGCLSTDSVRGGARQKGSVYAIQYGASYMVCSQDPQETYRQAGTTFQAQAAAWMAEGTRRGEAYDGAYEGCLDGLIGKPSRLR